MNIEAKRVTNLYVFGKFLLGLAFFHGLVCYGFAPGGYCSLKKKSTYSTHCESSVLFFCLAEYYKSHINVMLTSDPLTKDN